MHGRAISFCIDETGHHATKGPHNQVLVHGCRGFAAAVSLVFFYTGPLSTLVKVMKHKDSSSLNPPFSIMVFMNVVMWLSYGLVRDPHSIPHALNLSCTQSLMHSTPHALNSSCTQFLMHSIPHALNPSCTQSLTDQRSCTHSLMHSIPHVLDPSCTQPFMHSIPHALNPSCTQSLTDQFLMHSVRRPLTY